MKLSETFDKLQQLGGLDSQIFSKLKRLDFRNTVSVFSSDYFFLLVRLHSICIHVYVDLEII